MGRQNERTADYFKLIFIKKTAGDTAAPVFLSIFPHKTPPSVICGSEGFFMFILRKCSYNVRTNDFLQKIETQENAYIPHFTLCFPYRSDVT